MDLARRLAMGLDPVRLARAAGLEPDPWQADILQRRAPKTILLCSRQSGKSTVTAVRAVHEALFYAPALVLIIAPAFRQSRNLFETVKRVLAAAGGELDTAADRNTADELWLANGSRIVCLPDKEATIRSYSAVSLLVIDEAAWVRDSTYEAVLPMLAVSQGGVFLLSTPFGQRGFFHHEWTEGGPAWHRAKVTAHECPRISPAWLEEQRRSLPPLRFRSEYLCEFVGTEDDVFSYDEIMAAITPEVRPLFDMREVA
ncbi:MAG TPA: phage terminase large subunit [Gemmatimonadales bacterium]|nr:phage terminase large subunit [Gemmatimonadales bacterium]